MWNVCTNIHEQIQSQIDSIYKACAVRNLKPANYFRNIVMDNNRCAVTRDRGKRQR